MNSASQNGPISCKEGPFSAPWLPFLLLTIPPLCWAANIVLAQGVTDIIHPVSFAFWRWMVAFVFLIPFSHKHIRTDWREIKKGWWNLLLLGFLGVSCFNTLLYIAVHTTTAINGALIQTTMPAFIIVISLILYNERIVPIQALGVALCILGASMVVLRGSIDNLLNLVFSLGDIIMVIAVICYAFYSALLPKRPTVHMLSFLACTFGLGALGLLPVYIWELVAQGSLPLTPKVFVSVLFVALFPSILAFFCWNQGIEMIGANKGGLFINLLPLFASIMSIFWLGGSLYSFHLIGMILIGGGMLLFNRK